MGRTGIATEAIAAAVATLHEENRPASPVTVRLVTGTGSYTTICRALRELGVRESKRTRLQPVGGQPARMAGRMRS